MRQNYATLVTALPDERLEAFVNDWVATRVREYHSNQRWSGSGDLGRDVVGYVTAERHEGEWDNFQCKQLAARLSEASAFLELGKIFQHAAAGEYRLPRAYTFVAPRGVVRNVQSLIAHPERFRGEFLTRWDEVCRHKLVENAEVPLSDAIQRAIRAFDFRQVHALDAVKLTDDPSARPALVRWFDDDPGAAPLGQTPATMQPVEAPYLGQLVGAFGARAGATFTNMEEVLAHPVHGLDLNDQRTRFFDAASFLRYYRDSTFPDVIGTFVEEIYHGIVEVHRYSHADDLARVHAVMREAKGVAVSGTLARHARVQVKQGVCHHFANEGRLPWTK